MSEAPYTPQHETSLDSPLPTHPANWERIRVRGKSTFLIGSVVAIGVPVSLAVHVLIVWGRGDSDLLVSLRSALELIFTSLLVAPIAGVAIGRAIWTRAERRTGRLPDSRTADAVTWTDEDAPPPIELSIDQEEHRLRGLREDLEALARTAPERLRWRLIGFTALGYAYVLGILAALAATFVFFVRSDLPFRGIAVQLIAGFGVLVVFTLWVRLAEPQGRRVTRAGSPALFDALESIRRRIDAPIPDVVLLDWQLNASVTEIPRYGIFGLPKRYLVVGIPLLDALSADEICAILAHELAHLSRRHSRRLAWAARLSVTWQTLAASLAAGRHWGQSLFLPFFRWYAPRFALYAQAISRRDELEADSLAAECVGRDAAARALLRLHLAERLLGERTLPEILRESETQPEPPARSLERIADALRRGPSAEEVGRWTNAALAERTLDGHTHPSLGDRLSALGVDLADDGSLPADLTAAVTAPSPLTGAETFFGDRRIARLRALVGEDWQLSALEEWRRLHADARIWKRDPSLVGEGDFATLWARARWATACEPRDVAVALLREVLQLQPNHFEARAYLGQQLIQSDDAVQQQEGVAILEAVLRGDSLLANLACEALAAHYTREGRAADVELVRVRERQLQEAALSGIRERRSLSVRDRLIPYAVPGPTLAAIQKACAGQDDITRAFLVRKWTRHLRDQPCVILAVVPDVPWYKPSDSAGLEACRALVARIHLPESADLLVQPAEPRSRLLRKLSSLEGAEIYRRS